MSLWKRMYRDARDRWQKACYWLGPMYCILVGALLLFGSFIVQLLTSIGVPYIKAFDFFRFDLADYTFIELGMWAACNGKTAFSIPTRPDLKYPEQFNCPPASWGWKDTQYSAITDNFFHHNLPKALIMHPISCCFTFFAMTAALVTIKRQRQHFLLPIFSFLSCLFAFCSFIIDVATFVPARGKLMSPKAYSILGLTVTSTELGPAFWLSLACFALDIIGNAIIIAGYGIWRYQRISLEQRRHTHASAHDIEMKAGTRMSKRGYFNESTVSLGDHSPYAEKGEGDHITETERASGTTSALSRHSTKSRGTLQTLTIGVPAAAATVETSTSRDASATRGNNAFRRRQDDEDDDDENDDDVSNAQFVTDVDEDDDDGYDSAVSAYDDARSNIVHVSRDPSRSQVAIASQQQQQQQQQTQYDDDDNIERLERRTSSPLRNVRRKPVERY